jgi:hypothetical protein
MMELGLINWVEWFGYLASFIVLISLTMSSIIKLRIINLIGSLMFASFAYFIDSMPTMAMNLGIVCINIYYLYDLYNHKEEFKLISASTDSEYLKSFIEFNQKEIEKQTNLDHLNTSNTQFYMLRNNTIAGVLIGNTDSNGSLDIILDYVTPKYRDFKLGTYYYKTHPEFLKEKGISALRTTANTLDHRQYLEKMGFVAQTDNQSNTFVKSL